MNKYSNRGWIAVTVISLAAVTCNLPSAAPQIAVTSAAPIPNVAAAVATATLTAQAGEAPGAAPCYPMITAALDANIRRGPGTAYDIVGYLPAGGTARVAGRNDANTWWYIEFAGGSGGYAWVAGSVTSATCIPVVVQVVAAPALPAAEPTDEPEAEPEEPAELLVPFVPVVPLVPLEPAKPDLVVNEFTITPATPVQGEVAHVRVNAYNRGNAASGEYVVTWFGLSTFANPSCTWTVNHSNAHGGRILECDFTFQSWYPVNKTSLVIVDANH